MFVVEDSKGNLLYGICAYCNIAAAESADSDSLELAEHNSPLLTGGMKTYPLLYIKDPNLDEKGDDIRESIENELDPWRAILDFELIHCYKQAFSH